MAQVTSFQGDTTGAIRAWRAALEVFECRAAKEPGDTNWQHQLANGHAALGNIYTMKGDPENATQENRIAVEIYERLTAQDPDNAEWQESLAFSHFTSGNALMKNDATRGIQELRSALALYERLVAKDPGNAGLQNALVFCHIRIASGLFAQKQFPEALTEARAALAAAEWTGAQDPKNILMVQNPLAGAHLLTGQTHYLDVVPMRRIGRPSEVSAAVCFLLSEEAAFITGHTGASTAVPASAERSDPPSRRSNTVDRRGFMTSTSTIAGRMAVMPTGRDDRRGGRRPRGQLRDAAQLRPFWPKSS